LSAFFTSLTVSPGMTVSDDLLVSPEGGFNQAVSLACSGAPANSTCTVTPASVTLDGTNNVAVELKVVTTAPAVVGPGNLTPPSGSLPYEAWSGIFGLLGLTALAKFSPKGRRIRRVAPFAALALVAALAAGCGGGGSNTSSSTMTPPGIYTLFVTGTIGSLHHSVPVTLNVVLGRSQ
jgi:hypothetical protein